MTRLPSPDRLLAQAARVLADRYGTSPREIASRLLAAGRAKVPIEAFSETLAPFETIVAYLRDAHGLRPTDIARMTGRDPRAIGVTYRRASRKLAAPMRAIPDSVYGFPVELLRDTRLSVLEHVVTHLRDQYGLSLAQIARLLQRDPRTIGTVVRRAKGHGAIRR